MLLVQLAGQPASVSAGDLFAYYSRVESSDPSDKFSRTDDYADVIVKVGDPEGRLVFCRATSYLPCWETSAGKWRMEGIVPRRGDGTPRMPDRVNLFSHAEIIESTASKVVVHWRYLSSFTAGNPRGGLVSSNFVEELFTITPEGRIVRVIRQGTKTIDEWNDPLNQTTQVLRLGSNGITQVSREDPRYSAPPLPVKGNPNRGPPVAAPVAWFKFDEGRGDQTQEDVTKLNLSVPGHKALWKEGIAGTALEFDGYYTMLALPAAQSPALEDGDLTLEGWFALGAYPWNWAPIVQQGDDDGYFLGVDGHGYPGFKIKVNGVWQELTVPNHPPYTDTNHLALFRWYQIAGSYSQADGMMRLYIDGNEVAGKPAGPGGVQTVKTDVRIGKAGILRLPTEALHDTLPTEYGLDGLIDEVKIYRVALSAGQIAQSYRNFSPGPAIVSAPDMQKRALPNPSTSGQFKGIYTHLPYYETWENLWRFGDYSDVVVGFDQLPTKFVFWRGVSYVPMIVNEKNQWYNNEFNETGGTARAPGDNEPMSDKGCWNSHVRILENTPARVVVHWRCWLSNPDHHWANYNEVTGWGDISDWNYYIYPDGVAAKRMRLYTEASADWHEWDEQIVVLGEGQRPESVLEKSPVMTLVDVAGKTYDYDWNPNPPRPNYAGKIIQKIHFTGQYEPFTIQKFTGGDVYSGERTWYSVFPSWNHWPTAQINSSGRNACFPDRAAHCSVSHLFWPFSRQQQGDVPFLEKTLLEGMTDQSAHALVSLARSWLQPPGMQTVSDCVSAGYEQSQRAYVLSATGPAPAFRIEASVEHPIHNLCFVVKNWNCEDLAQLEINNRTEPPGPDFRQGIVRDPNGRPTLIVWLQRQSTEPLSFTLRGAEPERSVLKPMTWTLAPQTVSNRFDITMTAAALPGVGNEYCFERLHDPQSATVWQSSPVFTEFALPPDTEAAYRVKARDTYFAETDWSPVARARTASAPVAVMWHMDEGQGTTIRDDVGRHEGSVRGAVNWLPGINGTAMHFDGSSYVELGRAADLLSTGDFTWMAWVRTVKGGTILARSGAGSEWQRGGKVMFVQNGLLRFDVGWVGVIGAEAPVGDGKWHHVAVAVSTRADGNNVRCFVDGRLSGSGRLNVGQYHEEDLPVRIGYCTDNFPEGQSWFLGDLDEVGWYAYALSNEQIAKIVRSVNAGGGQQK